MKQSCTLPGIQGKGYGRQLFSEIAGWLRANAYRSLLVWVLEDNPSIGFYQRLKGEFVVKEEVQIGEDTLMEVALGWKDMNAFVLG